MGEVKLEGEALIKLVRVLDWRCDERGLDECWPVRGAPASNGYIQLKTRVGSKIVRSQAHRVAYASVHGDPGDAQVCHSCDFRICANPGHLFAGTNAENHADKVAKGRAPRGERNGGGGKLTAEDVRAIRALLAADMPKRAIARRFNIDPTIVRRIESGRLWSHV